MSNILIIKHGSLGDIAQASGAIQDISEHHKNDQIHLLTTKPYFDLFEKNSFIHDVILDKRLPKFNLIYLYILMRKLKKLNFQKIYDLQNSSRTKFYKNILFPKANINKWSSSETTLPNDKTKEEFDKWWYKNDPTHVCFFSKETFAWLGDKYKLDVEVLTDQVILLTKKIGDK